MGRSLRCRFDYVGMGLILEGIIFSPVRLQIRTVNNFFPTHLHGLIPAHEEEMKMQGDRRSVFGKQKGS